MQHYVELISRFGSADGFNTESPERLHIDYAKEAYLWLRRQESIDRFDAYLDWKHGQERFFKGESDEEGLGEFGVTRAVGEAGCDAITHTQPKSKTALQLPSSHPRRLRRIPARKIISDQHATYFLDALTSFFRAHGCHYAPHSTDLFNLYSRLVFQLPAVAEVSVSKNKNIVRASPHFTRGPRRATEPAHLDFALIRTGDSNPSTDGTCLEGSQYSYLKGLRVAQVRVIFTLPHHYPKALLVQNPTPLAYIEWFTPFHAREPASDMYIVSRSTRMHRRFAEIIPIERIVRSCHLIPDFGKERDSRWTAANVGLMCDRFFVNPYIDYHTFCLMKLGRRNCI
ncbi:hypothetical protein EDD15DRAFT_2178657 [Pisolithus albus]|nr:hypothetical protein EDD15DRAFT_2178657 [Pisolithus albus]